MHNFDKCGVLPVFSAESGEFPMKKIPNNWVKLLFFEDISPGMGQMRLAKKYGRGSNTGRTPAAAAPKENSYANRPSNNGKI